MKPFINLSELEMISNEKDDFQSSYGVISERIGAKRLGYNLTIVAPGKKCCPFHNHHINEEAFFIIQGKGLLRFGDKEYQIKEHDVISCPPGGQEVAHQLINNGSIDLKYLAISTKDNADICEYPDSSKVFSMVGSYGNRTFTHISSLKEKLDYFEGEK